MFLKIEGQLYFNFHLILEMSLAHSYELNIFHINVSNN